MSGGRRAGAGRPSSKDPADKLVTIKMTQDQRTQFVAMGGGRWVKRLLDEAAKRHKEKYSEPCPHCGNTCDNTGSTKSGQTAPE